MTRLIRMSALALTLLLLFTGCSATLKDIPVPGTGVSGDTIEVSAPFLEALNLAEGATVKVNGVDSGKVQGVTAKDFTAVVAMKMRTDAKLRRGATLRLRYTTPLGELFVDIDNPDSGELMGDGDEFTLEETDTAPTVEDALSQASLLINGGGLAQLQVVTEELNTTLNGREDTVRSLLERSNTFMTEANATTGDIDLALRSLTSLAKTLQAREKIINRAVREVRPAAKVLRVNTPGLTKLLAQVDRFAATANGTVGRTRNQLIAILREVEPILAELQKNNAKYPVSLKKLIALGKTTAGFIPNDYAAIKLAVDLGGLSAKDLLGLLGQLGIELPDIPLIPDLPLLNGGQNNGGRNNAGPGILPNLPGLPGLPGLTGLLGGN